MKLLEVVRGARTADDVLLTIMDVAKKIKKTAVISGVCDGFIGNRMIAGYGAEAVNMLEEGASVQQIDQALEKFGMAMGPFRMGDLAGNDIGWAIRKRKRAENPQATWPTAALISDKLCEQGRFGQKTGAGWYLYQKGRRDALPDPAVDALVEAHRREHGITPRKIGSTEIVQRCIFALVNEGARILEEGIAQRASDIDVVYIFGYGFPAYRGGPMFYADSLGLLTVERALEAFCAQRPFKPARTHRSLRCLQGSPRKARRSTECCSATQPCSPTRHKRFFHDRRRHRFHRPHAVRQILARQLQHDARRHARGSRHRARGQTRGHRSR